MARRRRRQRRGGRGVRTAASTVKVMPCSFCAGPKSAPLNECATCATPRATTPRVASCPRTSSTSSVAWPTSALTFTRSNGGAIDAFTRCAVCSSQSDAPSSSDGGATGTCHQPSTTAVCSCFVAFEAHGVGPDAMHRSRVLPWCAAGSSYEKRPAGAAARRRGGSARCGARRAAADGRRRHKRLQRQGEGRAPRLLEELAGADARGQALAARSRSRTETIFAFFGGRVRDRGRRVLRHRRGAANREGPAQAPAESAAASWALQRCASTRG